MKISAKSKALIVINNHLSICFVVIWELPVKSTEFLNRI
jgi:hypothetical protein